jgi:hypothetical protein
MCSFSIKTTSNDVSQKIGDTIACNEMKHMDFHSTYVKKL